MSQPNHTPFLTACTDNQLMTSHQERNIIEMPDAAQHTTLGAVLYQALHTTQDGTPDLPVPRALQQGITSTPPTTPLNYTSHRLRAGPAVSGSVKQPERHAAPAASTRPAPACCRCKHTSSCNTFNRLETALGSTLPQNSGVMPFSACDSHTRQAGQLGHVWGLQGHCRWYPNQEHALRLHHTAFNKKQGWQCCPGSSGCFLPNAHSAHDMTPCAAARPAAAAPCAAAAPPAAAPPAAAAVRPLCR